MKIVKAERPKKKAPHTKTIRFRHEDVADMELLKKVNAASEKAGGFEPFAKALFGQCLNDPKFVLKITS